MERTFSASGRMRNLACILLLMAVLLSLAGCGLNANASGDGKIHLKLWYWNRSIDDNLLAQVNKVFPNVVLEPQKMSDYDAKVRTTMAAHNGVPDILAINSNISIYFPDEDQFYDLNTLGAKEIKSQYLEWKWNYGLTPKNRQIAIPMDTGPTALFYRADLFEKAGLPGDPEEVSAQIKTWDDYFALGQKLKQATNGQVYVVDSLTNLYTQLMSQSPKLYFDRDGNYIGDQEHVKRNWDLAVKAYQMGIDGKIVSSEWNKAANNGRIGAFVHAVWEKQILADAAPDTKGKWRIARAPGGDGNNGGSFLTITKYCQHPKEAFEVIKWLQSPQNQLTAYKTMQLFPSAFDALKSPELAQPEPFFGGQRTTEIFSAAAVNVPNSYSAPDDSVVSTAITDQLTLIELQGKNPEQAWQDAQNEARRVLLR
uniref:Sugar ABC transporter substrate-binding protein n=1 Tax=Thermosporothrix sp. COM3 TaxID=2490863 RepID=A0A455SP44_9CHLR|nr:sugar ABC transporter substrate-binding protein [Thermosporothrix sp. COM3]